MDSFIKGVFVVVETRSNVAQDSLKPEAGLVLNLLPLPLEVLLFLPNTDLSGVCVSEWSMLSIALQVIHSPILGSSTLPSFLKEKWVVGKIILDCTHIYQDSGYRASRSSFWCFVTESKLASSLGLLFPPGISVKWLSVDFLCLYCLKFTDLPKHKQGGPFNNSEKFLELTYWVWPHLYASKILLHTSALVCPLSLLTCEHIYHFVSLLLCHAQFFRFIF